LAEATCAFVVPMAGQAQGGSASGHQKSSGLDSAAFDPYLFVISRWHRVEGSSGYEVKVPRSAAALNSIDALPTVDVSAALRVSDAREAGFRPAFLLSGTGLRPASASDSSPEPPGDRRGA
jgi:hypothetical protein